MESDTQPVFRVTQPYYELFKKNDTRRNFAIITRFVVKVKPVYLPGPDVGNSIIYDFTLSH